MSRRIVAFDLSPEDIDRAISEIERFNSDFIKACNELILQLTNLGRDRALEVLSYLTDGWTHQLEDSIAQGTRFDARTRTGIVRTECPYAAYVEFGTGIEGEHNSHPEPGAVGWEYDVNNHGDEGWYYYNPNDSKVHWTRGQPAKPFMWRAALTVWLRAKDMTVQIFTAL